MDNKRYVDVFTATFACPLRLREQIVFSYMANSARRPSLRNIAEHTGMRHETATTIVEELSMNGLFDEGDPVEPPTGWFQKRKRSADDGGWVSGLAYWRFYVPGKGLSIIDAALWSNIVSQLQSDYAPKNGFSGHYYEKLFKIARETFAKSWERLQSAGLINADRVITQLSAEQAALFADIKESRNKGHILKLDVEKANRPSSSKAAPSAVEKPIELTPDAKALWDAWAGGATNADRRLVENITADLTAKGFDVAKWAASMKRTSGLRGTPLRLIEARACEWAVGYEKK